MKPKSTEYLAGPTASAFHRDTTSRVKALMSGVGQGKSSACVMELFNIAVGQEPDSEGVRRTRMACIRATYPQLKSTTIKTVLDWLPEKTHARGAVGVMSMKYDSPITGMLQLDLPDGTSVHSEWLFLALDREDQLENLLSLELTAGWVNEASEINIKTLFADVYERLNRYPRDHTRCQLIADYNPPARGSWLYNQFEVDCPEGYRLWKYPAPVLILRDPTDPDDASKYKFVPNPEGQHDGPAFNKLGVNYWLNSAENRRYQESKLIRFITGDYPPADDGRPVHPGFHLRRHVAKDNIRPNRSDPVVIGLDPGTKPACSFQQIINGRLCILDEVLLGDGDVKQLIEKHVVPLLRSRYVGFRVLVSVDPSSLQRSSVDSGTVFKLLTSYNLNPVVVDSGNRLQPRINALDHFIQQSNGFLVSPHCEETKAALSGGFCWQEVKGVENSRRETNKTSKHSHLGDATQYGAMYFYRGGSLSYSEQHNDDPFLSSFGDRDDSIVAAYDLGSDGFLYV